jgi:hypothetical protein
MLDTFDKFRQWETHSKVNSASFTGRDECSYATFGLDSEPFPEHKKQCWCEPAMKETPTYCAVTGGDCLCNGVVYYGMTNDPKGNRHNYYDMRSEDYTANEANNTSNFTCAAYNFEDIVPNPEKENSCWCD